VHAPLLGGGVEWTWVVNVMAWLAIFAVGAVWRFSKDTARV
jgi:ABC-2 type transport system permease protein